MTAVSVDPMPTHGWSDWVLADWMCTKRRACATHQSNRSGPTARAIVDQDVEAAHLLDGLLDGTLDLVDLEQVSYDAVALRDIQLESLSTISYQVILRLLAEAQPCSTSTSHTLFMHMRVVAASAQRKLSSASHASDDALAA